MSRPASTLPTPVELAILQVLWAEGELSVATLTEELNIRSGTKRHYNTVLTIARVLERKGLARARKVGRAHLYKAVIKRERARRDALEALLVDYWGIPLPSDVAEVFALVTRRFNLSSLKARKAA